jgi:hypothetical protein
VLVITDRRSDPIRNLIESVELDAQPVGINGRLFYEHRDDEGRQRPER